MARVRSGVHDTMEDFMKRLLRKVLFIPQPIITRERALEIAHQECEKQGWGWDNAHIVEELRTWLIWTMGGIRGSPFVVVDQQTGEVVQSGCPLR